MITEVVSCGNDVISPECRFCPKSIETGMANWCEGSCQIDKLTNICQPKGMYVFLSSTFESSNL